jgi:hypothetical protein
MRSQTWLVSLLISRVHSASLLRGRSGTMFGRMGIWPQFGAPSRNRGDNSYSDPEPHIRPIPSVGVDQWGTVTRMRQTVSG